MKKENFPIIASGLGLVLVMILIQSGAAGAELKAEVPVLTMLFICEFGFIISAAGTAVSANICYRQRSAYAMYFAFFACFILLVFFLMTGINLWNNYVS